MNWVHAEKLGARFWWGPSWNTPTSRPEFLLVNPETSLPTPAKIVRVFCLYLNGQNARELGIENDDGGATSQLCFHTGVQGGSWCFVGRYLQRLSEWRFSYGIKNSFTIHRNASPGGRVADLVHFRPDPDPANQNFKIRSGSRILLALKESIQTSKFFSHHFFWYLNDYFYLIKWKNSPENV